MTKQLAQLCHSNMANSLRSVCQLPVPAWRQSDGEGEVVLPLRGFTPVIHPPGSLDGQAVRLFSLTSCN